MMYTMPKNFLSICVNFALATQLFVQRVFQCRCEIHVSFSSFFLIPQGALESLINS